MDFNLCTKEKLSGATQNIVDKKPSLFDLSTRHPQMLSCPPASVNLDYQILSFGVNSPIHSWALDLWLSNYKLHQCKSSS